MKDLIAKLQLDANCAMGAIWMHIDAQAARIAELEAQIAAASAPDVEQKNLRALYLEEAAAKVEEMVEGIGDRAAYDHREMYDSETERMHAAIDFAAGIRSLIPASAPQAADTDKLREVIKYSYELRVAIENAAAGYGEFIDPGLAETIGKEIITYLAASTALQAPVREVPGADHLTGKWCYSRDGEEFTGPFNTEQEAHAEAQEYAEEGEHYWVGQIKHPADCIGSDRNIGDGIITCADETAYDECGGDDPAFEFSHEQCEQLGAMVREFIRREGSVNRWAVIGSTQHAVPAAPVQQEPKP